MAYHRKHKKVVMLLIHDFIYPYLDPRPYKEAKSLIGNGYDVSIVCWANQIKDVPEYEEYEGIKIYRVFQGIPHYTTPLLYRLPSYLMYILKSIKKALKLRPGIMHCHDLNTLVIGVILKLLTRKPLIFDSHEDFPSMYESAPEVARSTGIAQLLRLYEKVLIKFADKVIAAELLYTDAMKKYYGISPTIIMNFPNLDNFNPSVDASSVIKDYELEDKVVISQVGAIGETRGTFETLEALQYLKYDNLRCFLIGKTTAELRCKIRETVEKYNMKERVILLLDGIRYEDIPKYYKASDITMALLYPVSTYITSVPTKLYESLAMGVPVVAANLPHIRKVIDTYEVGLCADSQDPRDIAEKLGTLMSDKQKREGMGQNGLKLAREEFNWGESEKRLIGVYEDVLSHE